MFFGSMCSDTRPTSLKIVGQGEAGAHGAGVVTFVMTSENSVPPNLPRAALRRLQLIDHQEHGRRPSRTTSPHDTDAAMSAARPQIRAR